ncbi:MAG TPA: NYN domain-containing protein [Longimicrobiaceae bacterium]|nr:NYN domain-containing protein [Longimicrobiaceae bacterium]
MNRTPFGAPFVGAPVHHHAPNAALLIDFDNVTVGIRSDLGKELKALLNSDIIKGKVAVQRAYADWRRYPQYIVPLAEASIDLIFAPAYGTSKKNATDLRMAVDAIELVFTRPEIGTFILLTGDSDFSSCVLKLKEYGRYVIGVGMRESSSDLLIQNCDEYYSYHSLSGLTRATVGGQATNEDPWNLVAQAARQMVRDRDAMRPDRLKQVMLALDPGFDEKKLGYSKFSRFVQDAAGKGLIRLRRGPDGQHEITLAEEDASVAPAVAPREPRFEDRPRDRDRDHDRDRRGRDGRRDRERGRDRGPRPEVIAPAHPPVEVVETPAYGDAQPEVVGVLEQVKGPERVGGPISDIDGAYALLQHAVRSMTGRGGAVRDADVKRKMLEMAPGFDETALGFSKFSRFLRQAHDAEAIDLRRLEEGSYEVALPASGKRLPDPDLTLAPTAPRADSPVAEPLQVDVAAAAPPAEASARGGRGRRGKRGAPEAPPPILPGQTLGATSAPAEQPEGRREAPAAAAPAAGRPEAAASGAPRAPEPVAAPAPAAAGDASAAVAEGARVSLRGRRGSRGRVAVPEGPPPLLPGQVIPSSRIAAPPTGRPEAEPAQAPLFPTEETPPAPPETTSPAAGTPEAAPDAGEAPRKRGRSRGRGRKSGREEETPGASIGAPEAEPAPPTPPAFSAEALGLPTEGEAVRSYLGSYRGVGKQTVRTLTDAVGGDVFRVMEEEPDRLRQALGDRRANALLEQWAEDRDRRRAESAVAPETPEAAAPEVATDEPLAAPEEETVPAPEPQAPEVVAAPRKRSRSRGRRGRGRAGGEAGAEAVPPGEEPVPEAPEPAPPAPEAVAPESAEGEGGQPAKRVRSRGRRGGRGRGRKEGAVAEAAPAAEAPVPEPPAPAPAPEAPAPETGEGEGGQPTKRGRSRSRRGGRGRARKKDGSAE